MGGEICAYIHKVDAFHQKSAKATNSTNETRGDNCKILEIRY